MKLLKQAQDVFNKSNEVSLAYLFGSQVTGDVGPMSDYDFAVYLNSKDSKKNFETKLGLLGKLVGLLKTDAVDLLVLNDSEKPELNYEVISKGKILKEVQPSKLLVESKIMNEYFDFVAGLRRYGLTKA